MELKNSKVQIEKEDLEQIIKYLKAKGFKEERVDYGEPKYLYILEDSFILSVELENFSKCRVLNYKMLKHEIYKPIKDSNGKLFYEVDWGFIKQLAERMHSSKGKYPPYNWKKEMEPKQLEEIKQATIRHFMEFVEGNYEDDGREYGHIEAIVSNLMMFNYQLKNYESIFRY